MSSNGSVKMKEFPRLAIFGRFFLFLLSMIQFRLMNPDEIMETNSKLFRLKTRILINYYARIICQLSFLFFCKIFNLHLLLLFNKKILKEITKNMFLSHFGFQLLESPGQDNIFCYQSINFFTKVFKKISSIATIIFEKMTNVFKRSLIKSIVLIVFKVFLIKNR